jgi:predicted Zn-dependent peptidase
LDQQGAALKPAIRIDEGGGTPESPHYRVTILESGLTVVTESIDWVRSVAFGVWGKAGSRDEAAGTEGVAHFLEHMFFKGSERRSAFQIAYELERLGGYLNAFTAKDHTCYFARILDEHLPVAVEVLADMVQRPLFDPDEIEREKSVVTEEIRSAVDTPDDWVHELFLMDLYGAHPLAHPVLGSEETVAALNRDRLAEFVGRWYRPDNLLVAAAGALEHEALVGLVSEAFAELPSGPVETRVTVPVEGGGNTLSHPRDISQVHVVTGNPGLAHGHPDRYALVVLMNLLAGGMSSRLFQSLRERRGLVYTISAISEFYEETGLAGFYLACAPENLEEALALIRVELEGLAGGAGPDDEELRSAKEQLKGHLMLSLESTFGRMNRLARGLLFEGRIRSLEEILASIEAVTAGDLVQLADEVLAPQRLTTTMLGAIPTAVRQGAAG